MAIPEWLNRETVQMFLIMAVALGVHYYFLSNRLANYKQELDENDAEIDGDNIENAKEE